MGGMVGLWPNHPGIRADSIVLRGILRRYGRRPQRVGDADHRDRGFGFDPLYACLSDHRPTAAKVAQLGQLGEKGGATKMSEFPVQGSTNKEMMVVFAVMGIPAFIAGIVFMIISQTVNIEWTGFAVLLLVLGITFLVA